MRLVSESQLYLSRDRVDRSVSVLSCEKSIMNHACCAEKVRDDVPSGCTVRIEVASTKTEVPEAELVTYFHSAPNAGEATHAQIRKKIHLTSSPPSKFNKAFIYMPTYLAMIELSICHRLNQTTSSRAHKPTSRPH